MQRKLTYNELIRTLSIEQKLALVSLVVTAVISCAAVLITSYPDSNTIVLYDSAILTTTATIIFLTISRYQFENEAMEQLTQVNPRNLVYIGDSVAGFKWFKRNQYGLKAVHNTVYRPIDPSPLYLNDEYEIYLQTIREILKGNCIWHDLECPSVTGTAHSLSDFFETLTEDQKDKYKPRKLKNADIPLLQITILEYWNGPPQMSFGYGFPGCSDTRVFTCSDAETIGFFKSYFKSLYDGDKAEAIPRPPAGPTSALKHRRFLSSLFQSKEHPQP